MDTTRSKLCCAKNTLESKFVALLIPLNQTIRFRDVIDTAESLLYGRFQFNHFEIRPFALEQRGQNKLWVMYSTIYMSKSAALLIPLNQTLRCDRHSGVIVATSADSISTTSKFYLYLEQKVLYYILSTADEILIRVIRVTWKLNFASLLLEFYIHKALRIWWCINGGQLRSEGRHFTTRKLSKMWEVSVSNVQEQQRAFLKTSLFSQFFLHHTSKYFSL